MKNKRLIVFIILIPCSMYGQGIDYGGVYSYGTTADSGHVGTIYIYPDSDSTLLFYLELNRGAPSYNSGAIVGQMNIYSPGEADFTIIKEEDRINCSMNFWFTNDSLYIRTNDQADDCGYGYGIYSDGDFKRICPDTPESFIDGSGNRFLFKKLDWKYWWE